MAKKPTTHFIATTSASTLTTTPSHTPRRTRVEQRAAATTYDSTSTRTPRPAAPDHGRVRSPRGTLLGRFWSLEDTKSPTCTHHGLSNTPTLPATHTLRHRPSAIHARCSVANQVEGAERNHTWRR